MIYILNTNHAYDQMLHATAVNKMISIIAAYTNHAVKDKDIEAYREAHFDSITPNDDSPLTIVNDSRRKLFPVICSFPLNISTKPP